MPCANKQPEPLHPGDDRPAAGRDGPSSTLARGGFLAPAGEIMRRCSGVAAGIRFVAVQAVWHVGIPDSLPALAILVFRAAGRSMHAPATEAFDAPVWRGGNGKRKSVLATH